MSCDFVNFRPRQTEKSSSQTAPHCATPRVDPLKRQPIRRSSSIWRHWSPSSTRGGNQSSQKLVRVRPESAICCCLLLFGVFEATGVVVVVWCICLPRVCTCVLLVGVELAQPGQLLCIVCPDKTVIEDDQTSQPVWLTPGSKLVSGDQDGYANVGRGNATPPLAVTCPAAGVLSFVLFYYLSMYVDLYCSNFLLYNTAWFLPQADTFYCSYM